jgi:hypothetical protein
VIDEAVIAIVSLVGVALVLALGWFTISLRRTRILKERYDGEADYLASYRSEDLVGTGRDIDRSDRFN